ncbi:sensor histidine kinase [Paenibacillus flagellatus]|uniref:sensor histidine kinase n=1 Tax=Paenibacillus flagellatus TaxID=2211139 RepID=UPI001FEA3D25|nr:histidine kinase [Paenibacillus flagellatus]
MKNSIVYKFSAALTVILGILFTVLLLSNLYSLEVVRNQSLSNSRNTLSIYVGNIHSMLNIYSKDLMEVFETNIDAAMDDWTAGDSGRYFKSVQLRNALKTKTSGSFSSDGMFIKLPDNREFIVQFGSRVSSKEKLPLNDFMIKHDFKPKPDGNTDEWTHFEIHGAHYLFKYMTYSDISFGTFVKADTLLSIVKGEGADNDRYVISDRSGAVLASTNDDLNKGTDDLTMDGLMKRYEKTHLFISQPIGEFGQMTKIVAKQSVFSGLKLIQWIIIALGIVSVVVVPLVLRTLARGIVRPVLELVKAAKEVENGQREFPIPHGRYSMEFTKLFHSFHSMVREITDLKIHTYEEKIERSRAELKYLQMQIRPHFFLNAISTISSLTYQNKNEEIRQLILHLSEHLRYRFKGGLILVPIHEEIKHVEHYIRMQEIRYPDQIFYMTDIDSDAGQVPIPQFLLQTFVENIFKHAMIYGKMLSIFIRASKDTMEDKPCVKIVIEDNGEGFPPHVWKTAEAPAHDPIERGDRVGIANIRKTLQLLYKRDDLLTLSNAEPSGAKIELRVPVPETRELAPKGERHALHVD